MSFPLSLKAFIMEPFDQAKALRARDSYDIFPLLIPLEDVFLEAIESLSGPAVFVDLPHE